MVGKKELAVALSGGSARGLAHVGFLEYLERKHVNIDCIVGTSMGAMVGGVYAAGKLKEFKEMIVKVMENRIVSALLTRKIRKGNASTAPIEKLLRNILGNIKIESLNIKFVAIATDLKTGKEVYLERGDLVRAIIASISLPGLFQPVKMKNMFLVDGGVVDPLPQEYACKLAKKVISVNVMPVKYQLKRGGGIVDILSESAGIMTSRFIGLKRIRDKKNLFIQVKTRDFEPLNFRNASKIIRRGKNTARNNVGKILKFSKVK